LVFFYSNKNRTLKKNGDSEDSLILNSFESTFSKVEKYENSILDILKMSKIVYTKLVLVN